MIALNTKNKDKKLLSFLQKLGSSLILPISLLPIAGIFISIGSVIPHADIQNVFNKLAWSLFDNLPTLILISISFKFSNNSGESAFFAFVFWLSFLIIQSIFIDSKNNSVFFYKNLESYFFTSQLGIYSLSTSVFGGILLGLISAYLYSYFIKIEKLNIYSKKILIGTLFIFLGVIVGIIFLVIWPGIYIGIIKMGEGITSLSYGFDAFLYGTVNRLLLPFGLHSLLLPIMLHSPVGGTLMILENGDWNIAAQGDSQIWMYLYEHSIPLQIARGGGQFNFNGFSYMLTLGSNPGQYMQGFLPIMIFAFPFAGWAMTKKVDEKEKKIAIMIVSFTPMLTGVTEPFEFLFVFLNPILYVFHAICTGLSFLFLDIMDTSLWLSSGWFVDVILFGIIPQVQNSITNYWTIFLIGPFFSIIYFTSFFYLYKSNID